METPELIQCFYGFLRSHNAYTPFINSFFGDKGHSYDAEDLNRYFRKTPIRSWVVYAFGWPCHSLEREIPRWPDISRKWESVVITKSYAQYLNKESHE